MNIRTLAALTFASAALTLASTSANALTFEFSFSNVTGNVSGTVTGLIEGLEDNTAFAPAEHVIVNSYPAGLIGSPLAPFEAVPDFINLFTVVNGFITEASFQSSSPTSLCLSLNTGFCSEGAFMTNGVAGGQSMVAGPLSFTPVTVPGPIVGAGLPGLVLAGGCLLGLWRRRQKSAEAPGPTQPSRSRSTFL
jgi:hypothetical protein